MVFVGLKLNFHISIRTVQIFFENACRKARIKKDITVHSLRHSYAPHLLESGVDIRYIQKLSGHAHSKMKKIYIHVSMKNLNQTRSHLDSLELDS